MRLPAAIPSLLKGWLVSFVAFGLLAAVSVLARNPLASEQSTLDWLEVARTGYRFWLPWALFAPLVVLLANALPIIGRRWLVAITVYLLIGVASIAAVGWWVNYGARENWPTNLLGPVRNEIRWSGNRRPQSQHSSQPPRPPQTQGESVAPAADGAPISTQESTSSVTTAGSSERSPAARIGPRPLPTFQSKIDREGSLYIALVNLITSSAVFHLPTYLALLGLAHAQFFYKRGQARERHSLELEAGLARARLDALRMQLQPHFLFNSLNAIAALIHKDPEAADEMVAALSDFLRLTLERPAEQELTLRRELEFVERYLAIEKVRFGERLSFKFDIPAETYAALVPTLMLQPLVENAVRHGLEPKIEGGHLQITAQLQDGKLVLSVADNGAGLRQASPREGIGLHNTRARLSELYGNLASLEMHDSNGVEVRVSLPFHTVAAGVA